MILHTLYMANKVWWNIPNSPNFSATKLLLFMVLCTLYVRTHTRACIHAHAYTHTRTCTHVRTPVLTLIMCGLYNSAAELHQSLLNHYERADFELSLPPPGRTGAIRNIPVVKIKRDLEISIEDYEKHISTGTEVYISYKVCVKVCHCHWIPVVIF